MSNLLNDNEGRNVVLEAQRYLLQRRLSRFFKRNLVIDYNQWSHGGEFDLSTLLGGLNPAWDDELRDLYRLLGHVGGLARSVADEVIYVDSVSGSDTDGTGSSDSPYASLWFLANLPRVIAHHYSIVLRADVDYNDVLMITQEFDGDGCLSIVGAGTAVDPYAGALDGTITANVLERNTWRFLTTSVAPPAAGFKDFIRMTSGGSINNATPICTLDAGGSRIWARWVPLAGLANGDGYTYAIPGRTIRITGANITALNGRNATPLSSLPAISRINFVNLNIDLDSEAPTRYYSMVTDGAPMGFWFCRIFSPDVGFSSGADILFRNPINRHNPSTSLGDLETESGSGINNMFLSAGESPSSAGLDIVCRGASPRHGWDDEVLEVQSDARIYCVDCMARWNVMRANVELRQISARSINAIDSMIWANNIAAVPQFTGAAAFCLKGNLSQFNWVENLFGLSDTAIVLQSTFMRLINSGGDASGSISGYDYCVDLTGISKVYMTTAWQGTVPTIADIIFSDPAATPSAAFPAADAIQTDGLENTVMRT